MTKRSALRVSKQYILRVLTFIIAFSWSWLFLIDVARVSNSSFTAYLLISVVFVTIVGLSSGIYWQTIKYLNNCVKHSKSWKIVPKIFFVWAFTELVVSWLIAVIWMGHNGSWSSVLPFSSLSPYIMWTPLSFASRFVGFYGLSAIVVTGIFILAHKRLRRYVLLYIGITFLVCVSSWALYAKADGNTIQATVVAEKLASPTVVDTGSSKLVVLPEYGLDNYDSDNIDTRFASNEQVYFVGSRIENTDKGFKNVLVYGNNHDGYLKQEAKTRLIPGGEHLSLPVEILLRIFSSSTYTDFQIRRAVQKGTDVPIPYTFEDGLVVGGAACSSIISTEDYRDLVSQGSTVLANSASLEIFSGSRLFNFQHRGLAKFMAVANARPLLQSSNNWNAFALDHNGKKLAEVSPVGAANVSVQTNNRKTPYTFLGEWVAIIGGLYIAKQLLVRLKNKYTPKNKKS